MDSTHPSIVVLGGGTGSFSVLRGLKDKPYQLTAVVNMVDNGGSTGVLRSELEVLPPGDIRQCLLALSTAPQEVQELFNYRFPAGSLSGHAFGNVFLSAGNAMTGNFESAVALASSWLQIKGKVLPVIADDCNLVLDTDEDHVVGEYQIACTEFSLVDKPRLSLQPQAHITSSAEQALLVADLIVFAPSDLYGSLGAILVVDGVREALARTHARKIYVANLVNKSRHTTGFRLSDYVTELERFAGMSFIDYVLYNTDQPEQEFISKYGLSGEEAVPIDIDTLKEQHYKLAGGAFLDRSPRSLVNNNIFIHRSQIRHSPELIADAIMKIASQHY